MAISWVVTTCIVTSNAYSKSIAVATHTSVTLGVALGRRD